MGAICNTSLNSDFSNTFCIRTINLSNNLSNSKQNIELDSIYIYELSINTDPEFTFLKQACRKYLDERKLDLLKLPFPISPMAIKQSQSSTITNIEQEVEGRLLENYKTYILPNGSLYEGEWDYHTQQPHGKGRFLFPSGEKFEGIINQGKALNGIIIKPSQYYYIGDCNNNIPNGNGILHLNTGTIIKGEFINGKPEGTIIEELSGKLIYNGNYKHGKRNGIGKLWESNGNFYVGEFLKNQFHGQGVLTCNDRWIEGTWVTGKLEGKAVCTWKDGRKYIGEMHDMKKHGFGEFYWTDGRVYIGNWDNDKQHGEGCLKFENNQKKLTCKGVWAKGKRIKWLND